MAKSTATYWNPLLAEAAGRWEPVPGMEGIAECVTLALDPETGDYTRVTCFLPGADTRAFGPQVHDYPEEVLILAGRLHDAAFDRWLEVGDYASRPPGEAHGPFRTETGCVVFEVSYPSQVSRRG